MIEICASYTAGSAEPPLAMFLTWHHETFLKTRIPLHTCGLNEKDRILCLRASLICLEVTDGAQFTGEMHFALLLQIKMVVIR